MPCCMGGAWFWWTSDALGNPEEQDKSKGRFNTIGTLALIANIFLVPKNYPDLL
jgi:hypothetical protein